MNWKVAAGFALLGALISLIAGIAGGNPFGIILVRLLLSATVFAALGAGVMLVLRRFMPELLSRAAAPAEHGLRPAEHGAGPAEPRVDIVIDGDIPFDGESLLDERPLAGSGEPGFAGAPGTDGPEDRGASDVGGVANLELAEPLEAAEEAVDFEGPPAVEMEADLSPPEGDGQREVFPAGPEPPAASWEPIGEDIGSLDALPELEQPAASGDTRPAPRGPREAARAHIDQAVAGQDPADLAKAVRTFLKKDQEG